MILIYHLHGTLHRYELWASAFHWSVHRNKAKGRERREGRKSAAIWIPIQTVVINFQLQVCHPHPAVLLLLLPPPWFCFWDDYCERRTSHCTSQSSELHRVWAKWNCFVQFHSKSKLRHFGEPNNRTPFWNPTSHSFVPARASNNKERVVAEERQGNDKCRAGDL